MIVKSRLPHLLCTHAPRLLASPTALWMCHEPHQQHSPEPPPPARFLPPRAQSVVYMSSAMGLHFGGYEFMRNSCLSLLTSRSYGFEHPAMYPLFNGLISPFAVVLLLIYSSILERSGPRLALRRTTTMCMVFVMAAVATLYGSHQVGWHRLSQVVIGVSFLMQNSYQHLLYTQQWSFVSSIVSPQEGSKWFSIINGCSSLFCCFVGSIIPLLVPKTGLLGLMLLTAVFLAASLVCGDQAYALSVKHGFDPDEHKRNHSGDHQGNKFAKTFLLFRRVPTLQALLLEVLAYQSLSTILNVAFVRSLKETMTNDIARSAYTGRFYALVNAVSTTIQFIVLPFVLRTAEHSTLWKLTPVLPLFFCLLQLVKSHTSLTMLALTFFVAKVMDYAFRSVTYIMVYQPLDFESRYLGKETIGLFGGRFGKSGMSLLLSAMTVLGLASVNNLIRMAVLMSLFWTSSCGWLARLVPSQAESQAIVEERTKKQKEEQIHSS